MKSAKRRAAVLISGRGSNMQALVRAAGDPDYPACIGLVVSDRRDAAGLQFAAGGGIPTGVIEFASQGRVPFETELNSTLQAFDIDLICLAGFMRLLSPAFVRTWAGRMINIHPSLLPAFPGLETHARALGARVATHGATVHYVSAEMDAGPIIAQGTVPVLASDDEETLAARVLAVEHQLYPFALALVANGTARLDADRVSIDAAKITLPAGISLPPL